MKPFSKKVCLSILKKIFLSPLLFVTSTFIIFSLVKIQEPSSEKGIISSYLQYLRDIISLNFGFSTKILPGEDALHIALSGIGLSLCLTMAGLLFSSCLGFIYGWWTAKRYDLASFGNFGVVILIISAIPIFILSYIIRDTVNPIIAKMADMDMIESARPYLIGMGAGGLQYTLSSIILGVGDAFLIHIASDFRDEISRIRGKDFIVSAEINGDAVSVHMLRNLIVPILSTIGARMPVLLGGVVVIETTFSLNGAGRMLWRSLIEGDMNVLLAITATLTGFVFMFRLFIHIIIVFRDPRLAE